MTGTEICLKIARHWQKYGNQYVTYKRYLHENQPNKSDMSLKGHTLLCSERFYIWNCAIWRLDEIIDFLKTIESVDCAIR